jgi:hypothetical protein
MAASRAASRANVTRRLTLEWPDPAPFRDRNGASIRILAVSDVLEPTLIDARNRSALAPIDFIVGCGDLDQDDLAFVADAFDAPLLYVHGNHDTNERWRERQESCPEPIQSTATCQQAGLSIAGLTWPGVRDRRGHRSETAAWMQAVRLATRRLGRSARETWPPMPTTEASRATAGCCIALSRCSGCTATRRWRPLAIGRSRWGRPR